MTTHSILAPSSAKRWTSCTASVPYCIANAKRIPEDRGSVYAAEGTQAHEYAEKLLKGTMKPSELPEEFAPVMEYVNACKRIITEHNGEVLVETRAPLFYFPEQGGTVDFALIGDSGIFIRDLKYGAGIPVDAEQNQQLAIYAQSLIDEYSMLYAFDDDTPVQIGIVQPRYAGGEIEKVWDTTVKELREFCKPIGEAAKYILAGVKSPEFAEKFLRFAPSADACHWCPAKGFCHARATTAIEPVSVHIDVLAAFDTIEEPELPAVPTLTERQIVAIYKQSANLKSLLSAVEDYLTERAMVGKTVPGTKVVEGRMGNREWIDEEKAVEWLDTMLERDEFMKSTLKSPTAVAKILKDWTLAPNEMDEYIHRTPGKPIIALETDKRPAISSPVDLFTQNDDA